MENILDDWERMDKVIESKIPDEISKENKLKMFAKEIADGGWYEKSIVIKSDELMWNSLKVIDGKFYRERVEVLVFNDENQLFLQFKPNMEYRIPGGSTEKGETHIKQAENETKEEARIILKDIYDVGLSYTVLETSDWTKKLRIPYDGRYTEVFVGKFKDFFKGHIHKLDADNEMAKKGKFYDIDKVIKYLKPIHKSAVELYLNGQIPNMKG